MTAKDLKKKYLDFFVKKGHKIIPSAPLVPENDHTTLFTSSGMQPLVPYLKGEPHPQGKRLANSQPCLRLQDIDEVGDMCHTTFFEMLGNWSLGDYFKEDQLHWIFEFLTDKRDGLGLDSRRLYVSVFDGDENFSVLENGKYQKLRPDVETIAIWKNIFAGVRIDAKEGKRIFPYPSDKNWWSRSGTPEQMPIGEVGGPDSEIFYDFGEEFKLHENSPYKDKECHPNCQCGRFSEIGNSVFIQYEKKDHNLFIELPQKNVDFGGGLERLLAAHENQPDAFRTSLLGPIMERMETEIVGPTYNDPKRISDMRIVVDHVRASVFLIRDGVLPSNKMQGYVLRRFLRRAAVKTTRLGGGTSFHLPWLSEIAWSVINQYKDSNYFQSIERGSIENVISEEMVRFGKAMDKGLKIIEKLEHIDGKIAFDLYQTYGFPLDLTEELVEEKGQKIDRGEFEKEFEKHQELSRTASAGMFKGGLADHSEIVTKYHTATHLLNAALRQILGPHVFQKGSNITAERLRFDFPNPEKLTPEQIKKVENLVNQKIKENLPVKMEMMTFEKAKKMRAVAVFAERYGEKVKVYSIGDYSKEVCGGPHVDFTGKLGKFKIIKEESAGAGIRRIYAQLR